MDGLYTLNFLLVYSEVVYSEEVYSEEVSNEVLK